MGYKYCRRVDKMLGHDYPGVVGNDFVRFELDELELGALVAMQLDDPNQWYWEIYREELDGFLRSLM